MTTCRPQNSTQAQIDELRVDHAKPIVICDVDEVVFHFIAGLEAYLERNALWLDPSSFALNGNIKHKSSNEAVPTAELKALFERFFDQEAHQLQPIDGAASALRDLSRSANIVMLTNLHDKYRDARVRNLGNHGMPYPVITNQGPKGPAVRAIAGQHDENVVFIDDIPNYLQSVYDYHPEAYLIHFTQDERFAKHLPELDFVSLRTAEWSVAHAHIEKILKA